MVEIPVGDLPDCVGNIEEQCTTGDHVSIYSYAGFHLLSELRSQDRIQKTLRVAPEPRPECGKVPVTNACHQLERP